MYSWSKKKKLKNGTPLLISVLIIVEKLNLYPINMDFCVLHIDALKSFLGIRVYVGSLNNFNFFNGNHQI